MNAKQIDKLQCNGIDIWPMRLSDQQITLSQPEHASFSEDRACRKNGATMTRIVIIVQPVDGNLKAKKGLGDIQ